MKLSAKKSSLIRSGRLHKQGSRLWKNKSGKAKSRNKKRSVENRQWRRKQRRKKPSSLPIEQRSRQQGKRSDNCSCNWRTLETMIHLMMKVLRRSHHKRQLRPIAKCFPETGAPSQQSALLQPYQLRRRPNLERVHHQLQHSHLLQHQPYLYSRLQSPLPFPTTLTARIHSSRR